MQEFGPEEMLQRLSDPFWFQAFGCSLGFDWHSSGVTTTVCGALKEGLQDVSHEIGLFVGGGKGRRSRKTPSEIEAACERISLDPKPLVYASRMSAKVDSAAVQDGYQIYQHCFIFTETGKWCVVQQGMNSGARPGRPAGRPDGSASRVLPDGWARPVEENRYARRYHWLGQSVKDFVCEPHNAVCCDRRGEVLNMVAEESGPARVSSAEIARQEPAKVLAELKTVAALDLPRRHFVSLSDIESTRMQKIFLKTFEKQPGNFEELLGMFLRHRPGKPASLKAGCPACPWRKNTVAGRWPQDHPSAGVARRTDLWHKAEPARSGPFELCARREGWPSVPGGQGDI